MIIDVVVMIRNSSPSSSPSRGGSVLAARSFCSLRNIDALFSVDFAVPHADMKCRPQFDLGLSALNSYCIALEEFSDDKSRTPSIHNALF